MSLVERERERERQASVSLGHGAIQPCDILNVDIDYEMEEQCVWRERNKERDF